MILTPNSFDLSAYLSTSEATIKADTPSQFKDRLVDLFYGDRKDEGARLPWPKTHALIRFRAGEVTLWPGINGHGKSQVTTQVALDMAYQGEKVVIGSFEMAPERTLHRMVRQASRNQCPSIGYIKGFLDWFEGAMWLLNKRGSVNAEYIVAAARYCADKLGATQFFVDNLAKCVKGEDDFNGQKDFVDQMTMVALETGLHIHIIHHMRKGQSEFDRPNKFDTKGSGAIVDLVDNQIIVWRNKRKEMAMAAKVPDPKAMEQPDCVLDVVKQRNFPWEGAINLWYHPASMSYAEDKIGQPKLYDVAKDHSALI